MSSNRKPVLSSITVNTGNAALKNPFESQKPLVNSNLPASNGTVLTSSRFRERSKFVKAKNQTRNQSNITRLFITAKQLRTEIHRFIINSGVRKTEHGLHLVPQVGLNIAAVKAAIMKAGDRIEQLSAVCLTDEHLGKLFLNLQETINKYRVELAQQLPREQLDASDSVVARVILMKLRKDIGAGLQEFKRDLGR